MSQSLSIYQSDRSLATTEPVDVLQVEADMSRLAQTPQEFSDQLRAFLHYLLRLTNARGVLWFSLANQRAELVSQQWRPEAAVTSEHLTAEIQQQLTTIPEKGRALVKKLGTEDHYLVGVSVDAIQDGDLSRADAFVCLVLVTPRPEELSPFVIILQTALGYLRYAAARSAPREYARGFEQSTALLDLGTRSAEAEDFTSAARALTAELQTHLGCFRVALGVMGRDRVKLLAISGIAHFDPRGTSTLAIESAMREAFNSKSMVEWPHPVREIDLSEVAHQELQRLLDLDRVISLPLISADGRPLSCLTFMWSRSTPVLSDALHFLQVSRPHLTAMVSLLKRSDPLPPQRWWKKTWGRLTADKRKLVLYVGAALLLLLAWPFPYHISANARIQPTIKRVIAAPFDGLLKKTLVEPGEIADKGRVLAVMDEKELEWKHAELLAARDKALKQRDRAMTNADNEYALSQMAQFEAEGLDLEVRLIEYKKENLEIKSPITGVVLTGDLKRSEGVPLTKGQILFEVAPLEKMVVEMDIPDHEIAYVREGMNVFVRLDALPGEKLPAKIRKLNPQSEQRNGRNIFLAEAPLVYDENKTKLRPGMKGRVVIESEREALFWILTHKLWDFLRMALFW